VRQSTSRLAAGIAVGCAAAIALAACGSSTKAASTPAGTAAGVTVADATDLQSAGGMAALVAAAQKEGTLNVITLPNDWANYGTIIKDFSAKYGIKINSENPDGSSQDEINAVNQLKGQERAPDVLDLGTSFAVQAASSGLLAPYKVASWNDIPASSKDPNGYWFDDYGGYIAIGYDSSKITDPPTSFADLKKPEYKGKIAINGDPTQASAAFSAVYAAALANGGSFSNIQPGIDYFKALHQSGNFVPVKGGPSTVESGETPILIWWDYLQASEVAATNPSWKIVIPTDAKYAAYYSQAISKTAPHPAAARLWEEYLYSVTGQNLWLEGAARPIELATLVSDKTVDEAAYAKLPAAPAGDVSYPSIAQLTAAKNLVSKEWAAAIGS
jgi:putative spermidine/putrescine transport system substrate-binding protein